MAKTRKKNPVTPIKGKKSNVTVMKKTRRSTQKSKIKTLLQYESPLRHLHHNGEQPNTQNQEDTKVTELENSPEKEVKFHPNAEEECQRIIDDQKGMASSTRGSKKNTRQEAIPSTSRGSDIKAPVKKRKLNKSPLSSIRETDGPSPFQFLNKIDESVICVDDIIEVDSVNHVSYKPQVNSEVIVVDDSFVVPASSEPCLQAGSENANLLPNLMDSIIVLDDDPQTSTNQTSARPAEDCEVVWSSLPQIPNTLTSENADLLKADKILIDTRGESSNLKYFRNDNINKKFAKKSPKVTKFGMKKVNAKKVLEATKAMAKTKITTTKLKTPVKKSKGDLIFSAQHSKGKQNSDNVKLKKGTLREIVIDGSNAAMAYTNNKVFNEKGIKMLIDYFSKKGHTVKVFIPQHKRSRNHPLLEKWYEEGIVVFTPSRKLGTKSITSYDDRYILEYAIACKGIVVSQDQFRDLYAEKPEYRDTIEKRLLVPTFVGDYVMFPEDPLGRSGPSLAEFLKH